MGWVWVRCCGRAAVLCSGCMGWVWVRCCGRAAVLCSGCMGWLGERRCARAGPPLGSGCLHWGMLCSGAGALLGLLALGLGCGTVLRPLLCAWSATLCPGCCCAQAAALCSETGSRPLAAGRLSSRAVCASHTVGVRPAHVVTCAGGARGLREVRGGGAPGAAIEPGARTTGCALRGRGRCWLVVCGLVCALIAGRLAFSRCRPVVIPYQPRPPGPSDVVFARRVPASRPASAPPAHVVTCAGGAWSAREVGRTRGGAPRWEVRGGRGCKGCARARRGAREVDGTRGGAPRWEARGR